LRVQKSFCGFFSSVWWGTLRKQSSSYHHHRQSTKLSRPPAPGGLNGGPPTALPAKQQVKQMLSQPSPLQSLHAQVNAGQTGFPSTRMMPGKQVGLPTTSINNLNSNTNNMVHHHGTLPSSMKPADMAMLKSALNVAASSSLLMNNNSGSAAFSSLSSSATVALFIVVLDATACMKTYYSQMTQLLDKILR